MHIVFEPLRQLGRVVLFALQVLGCLIKGRIRWGEVWKQVYEQGNRSIVIILLTSIASGVVLALHGVEMLTRFGAKEFIGQTVAISLVRQLGPLLTAVVFSGKAGAGITSELGAMSVNDQLAATRTMGVDPIEFLVAPRFLACLIALPILTVISQVVGIAGGFMIGVYDANIPAASYLNQTFKAIRYVDFFTSLFKTVGFSFLIAWICCFQGYMTKGGSLGVGRHTTMAVAYSYIAVILSNAVLTKIVLSIWG